MSVYTVHEPPPRKGEASAPPERFAFVRDGFYFWAFLFGPVWLLWRRLWLVTVLYLIVIAALEVGLWAIQASAVVQSAVGFLLALLIGFEAGTLRRWTLARRRWKNIGVVVADDLEAAERRFFASWAQQSPQILPAASSAVISMPRMPTGGQIVGLFPEPGAPR